MRRARAFRVAVALALLSPGCVSDRNGEPVAVEGECRIPLSAIGPNKVIVTIRNFAFLPDTVRIRPGTEVTWVNCETSVQDFHTSTSSTNLWDSGALNRAQSFTRRFDANGNFEYFCVPHPFMRGAVIVQ